MGRIPANNNVQPDQDNFLPIGKQGMLYAVSSALENVADGSLEAEEYHFKLMTKTCHYQFGIWGDGTRPTAEGIENIVNKLKTTFEDVERGAITEKGYFFELILPGFYYTAGHYHECDQVMATLEVLCQTYNPEDGDLSIQESNELRLLELIVLYNIQISKITTLHTRNARNRLREIKIAQRRAGKEKPVSVKLNSPITLLLSCMKDVNTTLRLVLMLTLTFTQAASVQEGPITLTAGSNGEIPFHCNSDGSDHHTDLTSAYYTVTVEGMDRPFWHDGALDPEGLISQDQIERFDVQIVGEGSEMSIQINIMSVTIADQGTYILMVIVPGEKDTKEMKKSVLVYIPPAPAKCYITSSGTVVRPYTVHCHTKPGNGNSTLACFQNGAKVPYIGGNGKQIVVRRQFWLMDPNAPISCCAHDILDIGTITEASCNQYIWPKPRISTKKPNKTDIKTKIPTEKSMTTDMELYNDGEINMPSSENSGLKQRFNILSLTLAIIGWAIICQ